MSTRLAALALVLAVAAACTPAQLAIVNQHQRQAGLTELTATEARTLYCRHGIDATQTYLGPVRLARVRDAGPPHQCPAPPPPATDPVWDSLAQCESGGNWQIVSANGLYFGGLQFALGTWQAMGGTGYPHHHPRLEQIRIAENLRAYEWRAGRGGYGPWPACANKLGLPR